VAIRKSEMAKLFTFLNPEDQELVLDNYTLVEPSTLEAEAYLDEYPILADEPIYVLNSTDQATIDLLNPILVKALVVVSVRCLCVCGL